MRALLIWGFVGLVLLNIGLWERYQSSKPQAPTSSAVGNEIATALAGRLSGKVTDFFREEPLAAAVVIVTMAQDGGVNVTTASRDPNVIPSDLLRRADIEIEHNVPIIDAHPRTIVHTDGAVPSVPDFTL